MKHWKKSDDKTAHRHVVTDQFDSYRAITSEESSMFSLHDTALSAGTKLELCYQGRREYVYLLEGRIAVRRVESDETVLIEPGDCYVVYEDERHVLEAITDARGICCFTPPTNGDEVHDDSGSYPPPD